MAGVVVAGVSFFVSCCPWKKIVNSKDAQLQERSITQQGVTIQESRRPWESQAKTCPMIIVSKEKPNSRACFNILGILVWFSPKWSSAIFTAWNFQLKFWNTGVARWVSFWGFPAWQVGTVMFSRGYVQIKCEAELEESVASLDDGWAYVSCFPIVCLVLSGNQRVGKWQRRRDPNLFLCG